MDEEFLTGIAEVDAQHAEIQQRVELLRVAAADKDQRHLFHKGMKVLNQLLITHFEYEEAMMRMVSYPEAEQHSKTHKKVLKIFTDYFEHPPEPADYEYFGKMLSEKVLAHVMHHDLKMTEMIRQYLNTNKAKVSASV